MGFVSWLEGCFQAAATEPTVPPGFLARVPAADADTNLDTEHLEESDLQGQSFAIEYRDSSGEISNRRITIRSIKRTDDGHLCICAVCWERRAIRGFRADRITAMQRLGDSDTIPDPVDFFQKYMRDDAFDAATSDLLKRMRPGLRVLFYLARCDGNVHPKEVDIMKGYLSSMASDVEIHWPMFETFLAKQHPDGDLAASILKAALRSPKKAGPLLSAAKMLIEADGVVTPEELAGLQSLRSFNAA